MYRHSLVWQARGLLSEACSVLTVVQHRQAHAQQQHPAGSTATCHVRNPSKAKDFQQSKPRPASPKSAHEAIQPKRTPVRPQLAQPVCGAQAYCGSCIPPLPAYGHVLATKPGCVALFNLACALYSRICQLRTQLLTGTSHKIRTSRPGTVSGLQGPAGNLITAA